MLDKTENTTHKLSMNNSTQSLPVVSWRELQGNKYIKAIDPGMLIKGGLPYIMKARSIGTGKHGSEPVTVIFDKEYVEKWIITKLIRPLSNYGVDYVTNLVTEAWINSNYSLESLVGNNCTEQPENYEE